MISHSVFLASYSVDVDLIPRSKTDACPRNTKYKDGLGSCSCEDHCGWDVCRLVVAPMECLVGTFSKWHWDHVKNAWVAQVTQDPYEYFQGCKTVRNGECLEEGQSCVSENQCTNCTFGKCIQLAKQRYSIGFSYSRQTYSCKLCTLDQLDTLQKEVIGQFIKDPGIRLTILLQQSPSLL